MIRLIGTTVLNDFSPIPPSKLTPSDSIPEWAARLCYNSNHKYGTVATFINGLMTAGHYDVIEHAAAAFHLQFVVYNPSEFMYTLLILKERFPYLKILDFVQLDKNEFSFILAGNLRVWREMMWETNTFKAIFGATAHSQDEYYDIICALKNIAPNIFMHLDTSGAMVISSITENYAELTQKTCSIAPIKTDTGANVSFLAYLNILPQYITEDNILARHATFQIDNVSRAFTHQHVRHRLLSHSQASQRYIDESNFEVVAPTKFDEAQLVAFVQLTEQVKLTYNFLRNSGALKEDARSILPNCVTTKIISSAFWDGWMHYLALRADKAAQEEIRLVAEAIRTQLDAVY